MADFDEIWTMGRSTERRSVVFNEEYEARKGQMMVFFEEWWGEKRRGMEGGWKGKGKGRG